MELLLGSTVLAALITSLVNIRSIFIASKTAKELEALKKSYETTQIAITRMEGIKKFILRNNITSISQGMDPANSNQFSEFIYTKVPTMFTQTMHKINEESHYFRPSDLVHIRKTESEVRNSFKKVIEATDDKKRESVNQMLLKVAEFNEFIEAKIEEILNVLMHKIGLEKES